MHERRSKPIALLVLALGLAAACEPRLLDDDDDGATASPRIGRPPPHAFPGAAGAVIGAAGAGVVETPTAPTKPMVNPSPANACEAASIRPTRATCFNEFARCTELADGTFCGEHCRRPLDCELVPCDDYAPAPDTLCEEVVQAHEARCGDVRYRLVLDEARSDWWFWDASTGALLAFHTVREGTFCNGASHGVTFGDAELVLRCMEANSLTDPLCREDQCGDTVAIRGQEGCDYELLQALPEQPCQARVMLDGQDIECNGADGWAALDPLRIRLAGSACETVRSGDHRVRVLIPCNQLPL